MFSSMTNEIVEAYDDHYSYELNIVKHHTGQNYVAAMMRGMLKDSKMIHSRSNIFIIPPILNMMYLKIKCRNIILFAV